jgi:hypothetical protein
MVDNVSIIGRDVDDVNQAGAGMRETLVPP